MITPLPDIRFFAPQGRHAAPIHVKLGRADGHLDPLVCAQFHLNRHGGWECCLEILKIFTFGTESPRRDDSLDRY